VFQLVQVLHAAFKRQSSGNVFVNLCFFVFALLKAAQSNRTSNKHSEYFNGSSIVDLSEGFIGDGSGVERLYTAGRNKGTGIAYCSSHWRSSLRKFVAPAS
jgi:hypothetical protein